MKDKVNSSNYIYKIMVGSLAMKALYPSFLAIQSTEIITEGFMEVNLVILAVNCVDTAPVFQQPFTKRC